MRPPRTIHEALDDAVIPDEFADYDLEASRQQIARDVADTLLFDTAVARAVGITRSTLSMPRRFFPTPHEQASKDLHALSAQALHHADAAQHLAQLVNSRRIDPVGALHFACLLNLAGCEEGAQFWWQFAAGAGNPAAAYCLYLLHLGRGELRDAEHWAGQAAELEHLPADVTRTIAPGCISIRHAACDNRHRPSAALQAAVRSLEVEEDEELGRVPRPDPCLANRIEELAEAL